MSHVAVTADARRAVSASLDGTPRIWDLSAGRSLSVVQAHTDGVEAITLSPDGKWVISCGLNDARPRIWDLSTGEALATLRGAGWSYGMVQLTPDREN